MSDLVVVLLIVLVIVLLLRGPKTLPQLASMFGRGVREARKEAAGLRGEKPDESAGGEETPER